MLYQYRSGRYVMAAMTSTSTTMSAITNRYSRRACHARSSRPVAAQVASGIREINPAMTSTVKRSFM